MNIHIYLGCFLGLFQVSVDILGRSRVSTVTQQQFLEKTFTSLSLEKKINQIFFNILVQQTADKLTIMSKMNASRTCGAKSMDGALVKLSTMKRKMAAARKKLSTEPSSPSPVPRSSLVPI
jgi:hypothetical protein